MGGEKARHEGGWFSGDAVEAKFDPVVGRGGPGFNECFRGGLRELIVC